MDLSKLRPLDAILTQPIEFDLISDLISWISGGPSHVRCCCKGMYYDFDFFEVTWPTARFGFLSEIDTTQSSVRIGRHKNLPYPLPPNLHDYALMTMFHLRGTLYNVPELLITEFLHVTLGLNVDFTPWLNDFVCSAGDEHIMKKDGFPWRPDLNEKCVSPVDIVQSPYFVEVIE